MAFCSLKMKENGIFAKNIWHILRKNPFFLNLQSEKLKSTSDCKLKFLQNWLFSKLALE